MNEFEVMSSSEEIRVLRIEELQKMLSISRSTILRAEKSGDFPSRCQLTGHTVGWLYADVAKWLASRRGVRRG